MCTWLNCMIIRFSCIWIIYPRHCLIFKLLFSHLEYWYNLDLIKKCKKSNEYGLSTTPQLKADICALCLTNPSQFLSKQEQQRLARAEITCKKFDQIKQGILQKILFENKHIYILQLNLYKESPQTYFVRNSLSIFPTNFHA